MADFASVSVYDSQTSSSSRGAGPSNHHGQQHTRTALPSSSAYTFQSPANRWSASYEEWKAELKAEEELKHNVASMFDFVQPVVQRFRDERSMRTDRAVLLDPAGDESGTQTPRPRALSWEDHPAGQREVERVCKETQWPEYEQESRPSTPRPFPAELPDEMAFLSRYPEIGAASITYTKDDGGKDQIHFLHRHRMATTCELIGFVFEAESRPGSDRCHLDMLTERTAKPFVRFLHIGSYALNDEAGNNVYDDAPTSLLVHVELCRLGKYFDLPSLVNESYVNIQRQCEFSCSSPNKPIDLEPAIRYSYRYQKDFAEHFDRIMDTFTNYCIACFYDNHLCADVDFKKLARENNDFYHRLYENSMNRSDGPEVTPGIVRLPYVDMPTLERPPQQGKSSTVASASTRSQIAQHFTSRIQRTTADLPDDFDPSWSFPSATSVTSEPDMHDRTSAPRGISDSPRKRRAGSDTLKAVDEHGTEHAGDEEEAVDEYVWEDVLPTRKHLRVTNPDPAQGDGGDEESEFETVSRPVDGVVALSSAENTDAESDWENVEKESPAQVSIRLSEQNLPIRRRCSTAATSGPARDGDSTVSFVDPSESDSEWSVVSGR